MCEMISVTKATTGEYVRWIIQFEMAYKYMNGSQIVAADLLAPTHNLAIMSCHPKHKFKSLRIFWIHYKRPLSDLFIDILFDIDGLVQERRNSSALAMELRLPCTKPCIWWSYVLINLLRHVIVEYTVPM